MREETEQTNGGRRRTGGGYRFTVVSPAIFLVALALRLWNAETAFIHSDELHYADDARWCSAPLDARTVVTFLREHSHPHWRLPPVRSPQETLLQWGTARSLPLNGHPTLHATVVGAIACTFDSSPLRTGRIVNAVADASTTLILPALVTAIGGTMAAGLFAAALYAVFPIAAAYGSILYVDALLSVLFVAFLTAIAKAQDQPRRWIVVGVITGLLVLTKQTGLVAILLVPIIGTFWARCGLRSYGAWLAATALTVVILADPLAYVRGITDPVDPVAGLSMNLITRLHLNVVHAFSASTHYWLSFASHGKPLAYVLARAHYVFTPVYFALFAGVAVLALWRRDRASILFLLLPVLPVLLLLPPTKSLWRMQIVFPLVSAALGLWLPRLTSPQRILAIVTAITLVIIRFLPVLPAATTGALPLDDFLFANPSVNQRQRLFNPAERRPFAVLLTAHNELQRAIWLRPGTYDVAVKAAGDVVLSFDGEQRTIARGGQVRIDVRSWLHTIVLSAPGPVELFAVSMQRVAPGSEQE